MRSIKYGRLGIGVKRMFLFDRSGRPLVYFGLNKKNIKNDRFLEHCFDLLYNSNKDFLNFFQPMNSTKKNVYDLYSESEWRILYSDELLKKNYIIDPTASKGKVKKYFKSLEKNDQDRLKYLIPLDGWR